MNWLTGCFDAHKTESIFSSYREFPPRNAEIGETGFRLILVRVMLSFYVFG